MTIAAGRPVAATRIVEDVLRHVPKTFDESWLREAWAGGHGRLRLRARVDEVQSTIKLTERSLSGSAGIGGAIVKRSGGRAGTVSRNVTLSPNGRLNVYHAYLKLNESLHRTGFASRFNEDAYRRYAAAGVDDVTVTAALSAGGYVWARTGFEFAPMGADLTEGAQALLRAQKLRGLIDGALEGGRISRSEYQRLAPRLVGDDGAVGPNTLTSVRELAAMDGIGERVLKGKSWSGLRTIPREAPWWSQAGVPSSVVDAGTGVAHLRPATVEPAGMRAAREAVAATLPEALDPTTLRRSLERATIGHDVRLVGTRDASAAIDLIRPSVTTSVPMQMVDRAGVELGEVAFHVKTTEDGLTAMRRYGEGVASVPQLNAATNDVLRGAGVSTLERIRPGSWSVLGRHQL